MKRAGKVCGDSQDLKSPGKEGGLTHFCERDSLHVQKFKTLITLVFEGVWPPITRDGFLKVKVVLL